MPPLLPGSMLAHCSENTSGKGLQQLTWGMCMHAGHCTLTKKTNCIYLIMLLIMERFMCSGTTGVLATGAEVACCLWRIVS